MFTITKMTVDGDDNVVSLGWCYETANGKLSNTLTLAVPYGNVPLSSITSTIALSWLTSQLPNTAQELSDAIDAEKAQDTYEDTFVSYLPNNSDGFSLSAQDLVNANN